MIQVPHSLLAPLAWIGRQGPRAIAVLIFIGIATPPLGALMRPHVQEAVFALLVMSFLRIDTEALRGHLRNPTLIIVATLWTALVVPLLLYIVARVSGMAQSSPELYLAFMLQGATSPVMATPAFALLIGLDAMLVLITLVTGTLVVPLVAPLVVQLTVGGAVALSPLALGLKLAGLLGGSVVIGLALRRLIGPQRIARNADVANGINVLVMMVFLMAMMGDVAPALWNDPWLFVRLLAMAFAVFYALLFLTAAVFWRTGWKKALSLGASFSQRNVGLMLAATGGMSSLVWLYMALCQFPIFLSPLLVRPMVTFFERREARRKPEA